MQKKLLPFVIFLCVKSLTAAAQTGEHSFRKGWMFGLATGAAHTRLSLADQPRRGGDAALQWKVGCSLHPKLAVLLVGAVSVYDYDLSGRPRKRDFGGVFPSLQYHFSDKFWVMGGAGIGTDAPVFYDLKRENEEETKYYGGIGGVVSAGRQIYRRKNFVVDLQARLQAGKANIPAGQVRGASMGVLLGINFW